MRAGEMVTEDVCEVFNEQVTYLFYGRAAYKYAAPDFATKQLSLYPVCFIFDLEMITDIKRIYPFDSGAMHHDFLKPFMHDQMTLADFEIEPESRRVADIVLKFFDTNSNYLKAEPNRRDIDPLAFESEAYVKMTNAHVGSPADERRVTIEVQAGKTVPFSNGVLKGIVVPMQYLDSPIFKNFVGKEGIAVRCYEIDVWNPKQSFGVLAGAAKQYLREQGYDV